MARDYKKIGMMGAVARWSKEIPPHERFWRNVRKGTVDECWVWTKYIGKNGYGKHSWGDKTKSAHKLAYELTNGSVPEGMCVCHKCDNRPCCNPNHLFLGTHRDNTQDAIKKGRLRRRPKGCEGVPYDYKWAFLNSEQVEQIRKEYKKGVITQCELAKRFGVGQDHISRIINRKRWP